MYEEIMRSSRDSFFALLNVVLTENQKGMNAFRDRCDNDLNENEFDVAEDNEWMQEYHIIYNSYMLDGTDVQEQ